MEQLAQHSMQAYRELIDDPDFWTWYTGITPIEHISRLPIASRPVSRKGQLKSAVELGRRLAVATPEERPTIQSPEDAAGLVLYEMGALEREQLRVLNLDTRNRLVRTSEVYRGSLNSSWIRIGEVFRDAVRLNAAAIIVAHNHPSGDPTPSPEDVAVTKAIVDAGGLLDIEVLDHLVIGQGRYISMKAKSLGFS